jgi:hypothetical protein
MRELRPSEISRFLNRPIDSRDRPGAASAPERLTGSRGRVANSAVPDIFVPDVTNPSISFLWMGGRAV